MLNEIKITQANDNEGYVFVSYSSKNRDTVLNNYLIPLQRDYGLRIYYDEAFEDDATRTWTDQMQENLQKAQVCLMFASSDYVCSYACALEVLYAIAFDIPILKIYLENNIVELLQKKKLLKSSKISDSTKSDFQIAAEWLEGTMDEIGESSSYNDKLKGYQFYTKKIGCDIESSGRISPVKVALSFSRLIKEISGMKSYQPKIDSIVNSINNAVKRKSKDQRNPFAELSAQPPVKTQIVQSDTVNRNKNDMAVEKNLSESSFKDVTSVSSESASSQKGFNFSIYGRKYTGNQNYFIKTVFEQVMRKHEDLVPQLIDKIRCLSSINYFDKNDMDNYKSKNPFITGEFYDIAGGVSVGTALNKRNKAEYIGRLLAYCNEPLDILECEDEEFYIMIKNEFDKKSGNFQPAENTSSEMKIGAFVKSSMRDLEAKGYKFSEEMLRDLFDAKASKEIFKLSVPFFVDDKSKIRDKSGHNRYWIDSFNFNGMTLYLSSQWYSYQKTYFENWYHSLNA